MLCADTPHRMFGLKPARATGKLYVLSFPISSCGALEILALVEFLSCALLADNCLVARYESCKEFSVSVCHNLILLVNNRSRTQNVPRSFDYFPSHEIWLGQQNVVPLCMPRKQQPTQSSVTTSHSRSIPWLSVTLTVSIILICFG